MNSAVISKEKHLLQQVIEASNAIRKKHKTLKLGKEATDLALTEVFKPVVTQLEKLQVEKRKKKAIDNVSLSSVEDSKYSSIPFVEEQAELLPHSAKKRKQSLRYDEEIDDIEPMVVENLEEQQQRGMKRSHDDYASFPGSVKRREIESLEEQQRRGLKRTHEEHVPPPWRAKQKKQNEIDDEPVVVRREIPLRGAPKTTRQHEEEQELPGTSDERSRKATKRPHDDDDDDIALSERLRKRRKKNDIPQRAHKRKSNVEIALPLRLRTKRKRRRSPDSKGVKRKASEQLTIPNRAKLRKASEQLTIPNRAKLRKVLQRGQKRKSTDQIATPSRLRPKRKRRRSPDLKGVKRKATEQLTLPDRVKLRKRLEGSGLTDLMIAKKNVKTDYIYWDDPNELVDRLRLLTASQMAGNGSHQNEIMSIIEELREAGIIY